MASGGPRGPVRARGSDPHARPAQRPNPGRHPSPRASPRPERPQLPGPASLLILTPPGQRAPVAASGRDARRTQAALRTRDLDAPPPAVGPPGARRGHREPGRGPSGARAGDAGPAATPTPAPPLGVAGGRRRRPLPRGPALGRPGRSGLPGTEGPSAFPGKPRARGGPSRAPAARSPRAEDRLSQRLDEDPEQQRRRGKAAPFGGDFSRRSQAAPLGAAGGGRAPPAGRQEEGGPGVGARGWGAGSQRSVSCSVRGENAKDIQPSANKGRR